MSAKTNDTVCAGGVLRYTPAYYVNEYIVQYMACLESCRLLMMPISSTLTFNVGEKKRDGLKGIEGWLEALGGRHDVDGYNHGASMDMKFARSVEETAYEVYLNEIISRLRKEESVPPGPLLLLWSGSGGLGEEWIASNHEYCAKDIDFKVCHCQHARKHSKCFAERKNVKVFGIPPQRRARLFVAVPPWWD